MQDILMLDGEICLLLWC